MPSRSSSLPSAWVEVLDQIQQGLDRIIAATAEREQALQLHPAGEPEPASQALLERGQALRDGLESFLRRTEQNAAEVEAVLEAGAQASRRWLEEAAALRQRLAEEAGRSL